MKKSFLLVLLSCFCTGLFAQKKLPEAQHKNLINLDPTQIFGLPFDTIPPGIICVNDLTVNFTGDGKLEVTADQLLQAISDNETPASFIQTSLRIVGSGIGFPLDVAGNPVQAIRFNCNSIGAHPLEIWAKDLAGNTAFCEVTVHLSDDSAICAKYSPVQLCVYNCDGLPMTGVPIFLGGEVSFSPPFQGSDTSTNEYGCADLFVPDSSVSNIDIEKDDNPNDGLDTYDLLLLAKHILGVELLDNPYKLIAADVNRSGSVTIFDIVEMRKVILGIYSNFPNNSSWRFIDSSFVFPNPANPFASSSPYYFTIINGQPSAFKAVGIKTGDLDCSASNVTAPDYPDAFLAMPDTMLIAGQVYDIPLFMKEEGLWAGYQFNLNFDPLKLEYQNMTRHPYTSPSNWNESYIQNGSLSTSWLEAADPITFGPDQPIATFRFLALQTASLKDIIKIDSDRIRPEAYTYLNAEKHDLILSFISQFQAPGHPIAQKNSPFIDPVPNHDFTPPEITCQPALSVSIPLVGTIEVLADNFLQTVSDNETPEDQIKISMRKAGTGFGFPVDASGNPNTSIVFNCNELGTQNLEIWAKDGAGNSSRCETYVIVQDFLGNCYQPHYDWNIAMCVKTVMSDALEGLQYEVTGTHPDLPFSAVETTGYFPYCGYYKVPLGSDIVAAPVKKDNPLNGVTNFDKILIAKHINGTEPFNSPYKMIAADIDRNGVVDTTDVVELEKLILGIYTEFPNNTSWRFVDRSHQFPDQQNPFSTPFAESIIVQNIQWAEAGFIAIKVGDVNYTAVTNGSIPEMETRDKRIENLDSYIGLPSPNPTNETSSLPVFLSSNDNLRLEICDLTGKLLWSNQVQLEKGEHNLEIPASAMPGAGIYIWRLQMDKLTRSGKILRL